MKTKEEKFKFIEGLKKIPIIQLVCERTGISRATYYRWRGFDEEFCEKCDEALNESTDLINDMSESQLISLIKDKNMSAIIYWLNHRHPAYSANVKQVDNSNKHQLSKEQIELLTKACELSSE